MFILPQLREIGVAVGGGAIVFAVTTLLCVKFVTIIASSIVGSTMIMSAIDFFMHRSDTIQWVCFPFRFQLMRAQFLYAIYLRFFSVIISMRAFDFFRGYWFYYFELNGNCNEFAINNFADFTHESQSGSATMLGWITNLHLSHADCVQYARTMLHYGVACGSS